MCESRRSNTLCFSAADDVPRVRVDGTSRPYGEFTMDELQAAAARREAELAAQTIENSDSDSDTCPLVVAQSVTARATNSGSASRKAVGVRGMPMKKSMGLFKSGGTLGSKV